MSAVFAGTFIYYTRLTKNVNTFFHFFSFSFQTLDFSAFSPIPPPLSPLFLLYNAAKSPKAKPQWHAIRVLNCRQIYFNAAERFGKPRVSRVKSAVGIYFRRGKQHCTGKIDPAALGGFAKQSADKVSRFTAGTHLFILLF